jgi:hypothetical protein
MMNKFRVAFLLACCAIGSWGGRCLSLGFMLSTLRGPRAGDEGDDPRSVDAVDGVARHLREERGEAGAEGDGGTAVVRRFRVSRVGCRHAARDIRHQAPNSTTREG